MNQVAAQPTQSLRRMEVVVEDFGRRGIALRPERFFEVRDLGELHEVKFTESYLGPITTPSSDGSLLRVALFEVAEKACKEGKHIVLDLANVTHINMESVFTLNMVAMALSEANLTPYLINASDRCKEQIGRSLSAFGMMNKSLRYEVKESTPQIVEELLGNQTE